MESFDAARSRRKGKDRLRVAGFAGLLAALVAGVAFHAHRPDPSAPVLRLTVRQPELAQLEAKRDEALQRGTLFAADDDYVPATLNALGREFRVSIRLKGDDLAHLSGQRWSLRVKVKRNERIFGMRRFALHVPSTRFHQNEPLYLDFLRSQGLLAPRALFVHVRFNDRDWGTMELEEHISKDLLEPQGRREGVILKYDEEYYWRGVVDLDKRTRDYSNWRNTPITATQMDSIRSSEKLMTEFETAAGLLRAVMDGLLPPGLVFDAKQWGRFLAACEIFSANHSIFWWNIRFYYNPLTAKLEPVGFDTQARPGEPFADKFQCQGWSLALGSALLADKQIRAEFLHALHTLGELASSDAFLASMRERERALLETFVGADADAGLIDWDTMAARARWLKSMEFERYNPRLRARIRPRSPHYPGAKYPAVVYASVLGDERGRYLEIANALSTDITIQDLRFAPSEIEAETPLAAQLDDRLPLALAATTWPNSPARVRVNIEPPRTSGEWSIEGMASVAAAGQSYPFSTRPGVAPLLKAPLPNVTVSDALDAHEFLERDPDRPFLLRSRTGIFEVSGWLAIPRGFGLALGAGTTLRFEQDMGILAWGRLEFTGTAEAPIVLEGLPTASGSGSWGGIAALESSRIHLWSNVIIRNTTGPRRERWAPTGGVTLRDAEVRLESVRFEGSRAEDALNLVHASFILRDVAIHGARSDAIDADFSKGEIEGGEIRAAGGDGIDVSGSQVRVTGTKLSQIADKAFSIGEASDVVVRDVVVEECGTGLVSKDGSTALVENSRFTAIRHFGLMTYRKKPVYERSSLVARNVTVEAAERAVAETGSRLMLNGRAVETRAVDVDALYREGPMRKQR